MGVRMAVIGHGRVWCRVRLHLAERPLVAGVRLRYAHVQEICQISVLFLELSYV